MEPRILNKNLYFKIKKSRLKICLRKNSNKLLSFFSFSFEENICMRQIVHLNVVEVERNTLKYSIHNCLINKNKAEPREIRFFLV